MIGDCSVAKKSVTSGIDSTLQQPLRLDEAQQQHDAGGEHEPHQHQDVAGPPRRKDVDEQQRDGARRWRRG